MKTMRGFTLIELMIVVVVIAIVTAWGAPAFKEFTANNREITSANMLVSSFHLARSEAIKRSQSVSLTAISGNWGMGWSIDMVSDGTNIQQHEAMAPQMEITSPVTTFTFSPQGRLAISTSQTIDLCDDRVGETGRRLTLEPIGRVSVTQIECP